MAVPDSVFSQYGKPVLVGNCITFTILPIIVVGLRFYVRRRSRVPIGIDDWFIVLALVGGLESKALRANILPLKSLTSIVDFMHHWWYSGYRRYGLSEDPPAQQQSPSLRSLTKSSG